MLHLVKMAVGIDSVQHLSAVQKKRLNTNLNAGLGPLLQFVTRNRPKRFEEILAGGSMYWIIKGAIRVRQRILGLDPVVDHEGRKACAIRFDPDRYVRMVGLVREGDRDKTLPRFRSMIDSVDMNP